MALKSRPDAPLVSVIMPMRNAFAFVAEALASVLQERQVALEVIVIDDGCTDNSRQLVGAAQDPRVRIVDGPQRGDAAFLNLCVGNASGRIIMRRDAVDIYPAYRIRQLASRLQRFPQHDAGFVVTGASKACKFYFCRGGRRRLRDTQTQRSGRSAFFERP